mgnify:CR=1 FL=1
MEYKVISADDHIHITRTERENPAFLGWLEAEDLNVANFLALQRQSDAAPQQIDQSRAVALLSRCGLEHGQRG